MNEFSDKKLVRSSLIEPNFMKQLESCLRFGTPMLVTDVEKMDPILNSVLNKERTTNDEEVVACRSNGSSRSGSHLVGFNQIDNCSY